MASFWKIAGKFSKCCYFLNDFKGQAKIYLVGIREEIEDHLVTISESLLSDVEIIHAPEIISLNDSPSRIVKNKPNSSMIKSINLLRDGIVDAVVSAGNTGCLLSASFFGEHHPH